MKIINIKDVDAGLYHRLKVNAVANGISIKSLIVSLIEKYVDDAEGLPLSYPPISPRSLPDREAVEEKLTEVVEKNVYTKKKRVYTGEKVMRNGHMAYEIEVDGRKTWTFDEEE